MFVSVNTPQFVHLGIRKDGVPFVNVNFELNYGFNPGLWGAYALTAGQVLTIRVQNYDTVSVAWYVEMFGIVELLA